MSDAPSIDSTQSVLSFCKDSDVSDELSALARREREDAYSPPVYVFSPIDELPDLRVILDRVGIACEFSVYEVKNWSGLEVCYFKRSRLNPHQAGLLAKAEQQGAKVQSLLSYLEERLNWVEVDLLDAEYLLDIEVSGHQRQPWYQPLQRGMDISLAFLLLVLVSPVCLLVALLIRLESPGPALFRQLRTGLFNQEFEIIKFRSMTVDAERDGARWAAKNDCRITRVGRLIRKLRIDELPQLLNVLKGDMSLIGPRPEREVFIRDLEKAIPFYRFRHMVKPGITGLAQVRYSYGASLEDARHKHRYDLYYIKYRTLWLDLRILSQTVRIMLTGQGV